MRLRGNLSAEYIFYLSRRKLMHMNPHAATLIKGKVKLSKMSPGVMRPEQVLTYRGNFSEKIGW